MIMILLSCSSCPFPPAYMVGKGQGAPIMPAWAPPFLAPDMQWEASQEVYGDACVVTGGCISQAIS